MRILCPDGTIINTGGKVVKTVAGYDMKKLFIGAMGTLGIILEVTLRLRPIRASNETLFISYDSRGHNITDQLQRLRELTCKILDTNMETTTLELVNDEHMREITKNRWNTHTLIVSYTDVVTSVRYQIEQTLALAGADAHTHLLSNEEFEGLWDSFYANSVPAATQGEYNPLLKPVTCKIGTKNMHVVDMIAACAELEDKYDVTACAHGGLGHGLMNVYLIGTPINVATMITALRDKVLAETGGYCIVRHAPASMRMLINPWGAPRSAYSIMQKIKDKLDPQHLLNRDRYMFVYGGEA
jgi:glycolate oxidase FAD binding subunit